MKTFLQILTLYPFLALLLIIAYLPSPLQRLVSKLFSFLICYAIPSRQKIISNNIDIAYPQISQEEKKELITKNYQMLGYSIIEMAQAWFLPVSYLKKRVMLKGTEHLENAKKANQGVVILVPHYCNVEIIGILLSIKQPIHITYQIAKNATFNHFQNNRRNRTIKTTISSKNLRQMIRVLKNKELLCYAPDQSKYESNAPYIPFFSKKVKTTTGTVKLAKAGNAQVIPLFAYYDSDLKKYSLELQPALKFIDNDNIKNTTIVNQAIESLILKNPKQYLWAHKRFKDYL